MTAAGAGAALRVSLRGAHEGSAEPRVVTPGDPAAAQELAGHRVLVEAAGMGAGSAQRDRGPRSAASRHEVVVDGWRFEVDVEPEARAELRERAVRHRGEAGQSGPSEVRAIIPGVVVSVAVAAGDAVEAGRELLVVEAMKMQNELRAPRAGTVARVAVGKGATIEVGDLLVVIE
jgi:biotin carboxyl carrier protein